MSATKEIMTSSFGALEMGADIQDAMAECAGLEFRPDRVRIPAGGGTAFELPGDNEETELVKDITGVILYSHPANAYYSEKYQGGNAPPECGSFDGITGKGCPGGECSKCPYNTFGSGEGKSKACKNRRMLYILQENEFFPILLTLPTGSLKEFSQFAKRQLSKGRKLSDLVTRITLKKAQSSSGITFSQAVFSMVRSLEADEKKAILPVISQVHEYAASLTTASLTQIETDYASMADTAQLIEPLV